MIQPSTDDIMLPYGSGAAAQHQPGYYLRRQHDPVFGALRDGLSLPPRHLNHSPGQTLDVLSKAPGDDFARLETHFRLGHLSRFVLGTEQLRRAGALRRFSALPNDYADADDHADADDYPDPIDYCLPDGLGNPVDYEHARAAGILTRAGDEPGRPGKRRPLQPDSIHGSHGRRRLSCRNRD